MFNLGYVSKIYGLWGRIPLIYNLSNLITYLGKEKFLRWRLISQLKLKPSSTILDIACGNGSNFEILKKYLYKEGQIHGFDYSMDMLQAAKRRIQDQSWKNIHLRRGDAANLPYKDSYFDVAISTLGISAIPNFKGALIQAHRVLQEGGIMGILDAKLFEGTLRILNPAIKIIYSVGASWDYTKDIIGEFKRLFKKVQIEKYNGGTMYILIGKK